MVDAILPVMGVGAVAEQSFPLSYLLKLKVFYLFKSFFFFFSFWMRPAVTLPHHCYEWLVTSVMEMSQTVLRKSSVPVQHSSCIRLFSENLVSSCPSQKNLLPIPKVLPWTWPPPPGTPWVSPSLHFPHVEMIRVLLPEVFLELPSSWESFSLLLQHPAQRGASA